MLFSSYIFILVFLPIVLIGYFVLNKMDIEREQGKWWLVLSSLFFYGYWHPSYLLIILSSILVNYFLAEKLQTMEFGKKKKLYFILGLIFNIGLLGYFKYRDFFLENINFVFTTDYHFASLALPLGISFFTLQQLAYIVDVYEGVAKEKRFVDYSLFVCFFPQLIAGPIVHYKEVMPQFEAKDNNHFNISNFNLGIYIFALGLFKKVIFADTFAGWANEGFDHTQVHHFFAAWGTSLSYTMQLYFDFSGYSDMAIGLGHMFNIKIPKNFNSPFRARNVIDFWTRWHITLSQFITTYIFTPIFRSFKKLSHRNSLIAAFTTMLIAGVWHGAGWTFIVYGCMYGTALVINHRMKKKKIKLPKWLAVFLTFQFTNIVFAMFRANTVSDALNLYKGMFGFTYLQIPKGIMKAAQTESMGFKVGQYMNNDQNLNLLMIIICLFIVFRAKNSMERMKDFAPSNSLAVWTAFMFVLSMFGINRVSDFIYFNF
jgi:D-alanyl-lipoteichoic acid acyltransferase DltB (MBOAT superfamily)